MRRMGRPAGVESRGADHLATAAPAPGVLEVKAVQKPRTPYRDLPSAESSTS
ncbi:hypothetical protein [Kitasatospora sp. NPDC051914]|uniref:hypothetical protein n=1 Tax=Kitasatospora sp. NPDC051914 TaxID=3154945 RepID=UPI00343206C6